MADRATQGAVEVDDLWEEPDVERVRAVLEPVGAPWWVAAGMAIDLFVGHKTREHHDVDVAILRRDAEFFRRELVDWEIGVAVTWAGIPGESERILQWWEPETPLHERAEAMWCRPRGKNRFVFELLLNRADERTWYFKRDHSITLSLERFGLKTAKGVPLVAPEVVLLHKATSVAFDEEDTQDFHAVLPRMGEFQREWLRESLAHLKADHPWIVDLERE
ncbi:MAG: amino acid transporter [Actinobacteria bacterium]|nr:amino acid transporter [Actinomycetota bacterium]